MAAERLTIRQIREVLRLKWELGYPDRQTARPPDRKRLWREPPCDHQLPEASHVRRSALAFAG